ncbi:hypothetical protein TNCV_2220941 [Trichonephila clavipes]|nr:hypothetical protein TNCV_2220941 [Trichonephila clavipes]
MIGTRNWVHLPYKEVPSTDVAVPDLSQSSAKETDSGDERSPPVPDRPFPRRSGRIRRPPGETCSLRREEMWYI